MDEKLDLRDVLTMLRRQLPMIAAAVVCGAFAAVAFLLTATPEYVATARLKFDPGQFQISDDKSSIGPELFDRLIRSEIAVIRSPEILREALASQGLRDDPELNGIGLRERLATLLARFGVPIEPIDPADRVLDRFEQKLSVDQTDGANLITISYWSAQREKTAAVANAVATTYLARHLDNRFLAMPLAASWLNDRKAALREQWRRSEQLVEEFKAEHDLSYVGGESLREQQIARLNEQLVMASAAAEEAKARLDQLRSLLDSRDHGQLSNVVTSENMTALRDRLSAAAQRLSSLEVNLLPAHPAVRELQSEIGSLTSAILDEAMRDLERRDFEHRAAVDRVKLIDANLQRTIGIRGASGDQLVKLRELERNAASDRAIYEAFLNRSNEMVEQSTGQLANFRLIEAEVPTQPSSPSPARTLFFGIVGSLGAGIGLAFLLESLVSGFRSGREVAEELGVPHLGSLPAAEMARFLPDLRWRRGETFLPRAMSAFGRAVFAIRSGLPHVFGSMPQVLAVASARPGDGASSVAAAIAQDAGLKGMRVLLVVGSGGRARRKSAPAAGAGTPNGILQVSRHPSNRFDVLALDAKEGATAASLAAQRSSSALRLAKRTYAVVVVDAGAITGGPEPCSLCREADATVLVVRSRRTPRDAVRDAVEALRRCGIDKLGIVLNFADLGEAARSQPRLFYGISGTAGSEPPTIEVRGLTGRAAAGGPLGAPSSSYFPAPGE